MIIETENEIIIKIYEFYKFLKYYNKYLNEWSDKNDLDHLEKSYKILYDNAFQYKLNCAKGWGQKNIYDVNQYVLYYINPDLYDEYKRHYKNVNNINMLKVKHYNIVFYDYIINKNSSNKLCLKTNIFKSYTRFLKKRIIIKDYTDKLKKQLEKHRLKL